MVKRKEFVFLYPIKEIFDFEIGNQVWHLRGEEADTYRKKYSDILNQCIDKRYRQKCFGINYVVFIGSPVCNIINFQSSDRIIEVEIDFKTHTARGIYPDQDKIINQLKGVQELRIAGFHIWDCVEKLAKRVFEKGINVLVDEDLTEFFPQRMKDEYFKTGEYPTYNPRKNPDGVDRKFIKDFLEARKDKPWLWQKY